MRLLKVKDKFLDDCRMKMLLDKTIQNYDDFLNMFINYADDCDIYYLDSDLVDAYRLSLVSRNLSSSTVGTYLRHLKVFLKFCYDYEYISDDFYKKIKVPKQRKRILDLYDDSEIYLILDTVLDGTWLGLRNGLIVSFMLDSGLRLNEVTTIKYSDIDFKTNVLLVHGKGDKERLVPLGNYTVHLIHDYMYGLPYAIDDFLLLTIHGHPITRNAIRLMVYALSQSLGFKFSPHKLRHNFATNYCIDSYHNTGSVDIYKLMVLMGHEDVKTTRIYLHMANQVLVSKNQTSHFDKIGMVLSK